MSIVSILFDRPALDENLDTPLVISGELPSYTLGAPYSESLSVTGNVGKFSAFIESDSRLPPNAYVVANNFSNRLELRWPAFESGEGSGLINGDFSLRSDGWQESPGWTFDGNSAVFHNFSGRAELVHQPTPAKAGDSITLSVDVQQGASSAGNAGAGVGLRWYVGDVPQPTQDGNMVMQGAGGAWHTSTLTATAPPGTTQVSAVLTGVRKRENKRVWADNMRWDHTWVVGVDTSEPFYAHLKVVDSRGRVAYWEGYIGSKPGAVLTGMRSFASPQNNVVFDLVGGSWVVTEQDAAGPVTSLGPIRALAGEHIMAYHNNVVYRWKRGSYAARSAWLTIPAGLQVRNVFISGNYTVLFSTDVAYVSPDGVTPPVASGWNYTPASIERLPSGRWVAFHQRGKQRLSLYSDQPFPTTWQAVGVGSPGEATNQQRYLARVGNSVGYVADINFPPHLAITADGINWTTGATFSGSMAAPICAFRGWEDGLSVFVNTNGFGARTTDGGATWAEFSIPFTVSVLATGSLTRFENSLLLCPGGDYAGAPWMSTDLGATWAQLPTMPPSSGAQSAIFLSTL